jgi:hypothetical protein
MHKICKNLQKFSFVTVFALKLSLVFHDLKKRENSRQKFEKLSIFAHNFGLTSPSACFLFCLWEIAWYEATAKEYPIISEVYPNLQE